MTWLASGEAWVALGTLTALEIVLGVDNLIFIAILTGKLPVQQQRRAQMLGLGVAMASRIALLFALVWIMGLTGTLFQVLGQAISGRDLILIGGGAFLLGKSTLEIHENLEGKDLSRTSRGRAKLAAVLVQIILLDIVFSLDSVITAIGLVQQVGIMVSAIVIAVLCMMIFSGAITRFIERRPTMKMLALSFLLLVGVALLAEAFDVHIPRGYIYFAMAFSLFVELLNTRLRRQEIPPVHLRRSGLPEAEPADRS